MNLNDILNIINTGCQIIMAVSAIVAIIITIKQINSRSGINLKTKFRVSEAIGFKSESMQINSREDFEHVPIISIEVYNDGISNVFINSIGMACIQKGKKNKKYVTGEYMVNEQDFILEPGVYKSVSLHHLEIWLDSNNRVEKYDDICVVINYNMDKTKYYKTSYNFGMVKKEWEDRIEKIQENDDKFFLQQMAKKILK